MVLEKLPAVPRSQILLYLLTRPPEVDFIAVVIFDIWRSLETQVLNLSAFYFRMLYYSSVVDRIELLAFAEYSRELLKMTFFYKFLTKNFL